MRVVQDVFLPLVLRGRAEREVTEAEAGRTPRGRRTGATRTLRAGCVALVVVYVGFVQVER